MAWMWGVLVLSSVANAQSPSVTLTLHSAAAVEVDPFSSADLFWRAVITASDGTFAACSTRDDHQDDVGAIAPGWQCTLPLPAGVTGPVSFQVELVDHDTGLNLSDDDLDIHPLSGFRAIAGSFDPLTHLLTIPSLPAFTGGICGGVVDSQGDEDSTLITFSITSSRSANGDSDGDGLLDVFEICGIDMDGDGTPEVDLPAMGADPFRKDLFVEADWTVDDDGAGSADHSHAPSLPGLVHAWEELQRAFVSNPPDLANDPSAPGIALHVDVGSLFIGGYGVDLNGDGVDDLATDANGNLDIDGDGIVDIGDFGGGNRVCADGTAAPCPMAGEPAVIDDDTAQTIRSNNFDLARDFAFRQVLFGHSLGPCSTTSGIAGRGGIDFLVTLRLADPGCPTTGWTAESRFLDPDGLTLAGNQREFVGTFLHELGHRLGLGHGGGDGVNNKPNYISVMSYSYQFGVPFDFDDDGTSDRVPVDLDHDGQPDERRFFYSRRELALLDEALLDERIGVVPADTLGDTQEMLFVGPSIDTDGDGACDVCPEWLSVQSPVDWSRSDADGDGVVDNDVPVVVDANFDDDISVLQPFDDHPIIRDVGFSAVSLGGTLPDGLRALPGTTSEDARGLSEAAERYVPFDALGFAELCLDDAFLDFDDLATGPLDPGPLGAVVAVEGTALAVLDDAGRDGWPTTSPTQSLTADRLTIRLDPPQRSVALQVGKIADTLRPTELGFLMRDARGVSMGEHFVELPSQASGIDTFVGLVARFGDEPIHTVEIVADQGAVHIDDLWHCADKVQPLEVPELPTPPEFGETPVTLDVRAVAVYELEPLEGDEEHIALGRFSVPALVTVDGESDVAPASTTVPEGTTVTVSALAKYNDGDTSFAFHHWELGHTRFGTGVLEVPVPLYGGGQLTAVYFAPPGAEPPTRGGCLGGCATGSSSGGAGLALLLVAVLFRRRV
ncbi:MAG: hypothetical protein KTR31_12085 [Myxococcales bacterium]|nr:hypothetical protein [Myxococcales bacterium]